MQVAGIKHLIKAALQDVAAVAPKSSGTSFLRTLVEAQSAAAQHTVASGETLSAICRDYLKESGASPSHRDIYAAVAKVASANGLRNPDVIRIGQRLDLSVLGASFRAAAPVTPTLSPSPSEAKAVSAAGIRPDPMAAVSQGPMEPLAPGCFPSQAALAALQPGFASLGLHEAPFAPPVPLEEATPFDGAPVLSEAAESLSGVGPLAAAGEGQSIIPASVALERVVKLMESLVEPHGKPEEGLAVNSPWSKVLGQPAHLASEFGIRCDPSTRRWVQHDGIDLATPRGTEVTPMEAGDVVYSGWQEGYGKTVIVRHDDGLETVYGHNSKLLVRTGERVSENTPLAEVGSTGRSTGPHLHFEVRRDGRAVDPIPYLASTSMDIAKAF